MSEYVISKQNEHAIKIEKNLSNTVQIFTHFLWKLHEIDRFVHVILHSRGAMFYFGQILTHLEIDRILIFLIDV